mgnify:CR=1 FL=1
MANESVFFEIRGKIIDKLRNSGIKNENVLNAISLVPRHIYVESALHARAYDDDALPIGYNPSLDRLISGGTLKSIRSFFICRIGPLKWETTTMEKALACRYGSPFPYANAIMIAEFGGAS